MAHLQVEELRRHGGLAMRRKPHAVRIDELPHPFEIMLELLAVENGDRQAQVFAKQVPAELRELFRLQFTVNQPQSLVLRGDQGERISCGCESVAARQMSLRNPAVFDGFVRD